MADVDFSELKGFLNNLVDSATPTYIDEIHRKAVNKIAAVYIGEAKRNTPTKGVQRKEVVINGETKVITSDSEHMKRSWKASSAKKKGHDYIAKVMNTASYASFVNDGHRQHPGQFIPILGKRLVNGWVNGLHMAEKAESHAKNASKFILENTIKDYNRKAFK